MALRYDGGYTPDDAFAPLPEVDRYSVQNEPNRGQYLWPQGQAGSTAPRLVARLMSSCMPAIQEANPNTEVALGPIASRGAQGGLPPLSSSRPTARRAARSRTPSRSTPTSTASRPHYEPNEHLADGAITLRNLNQLEAQLKLDYARPVDVWLTEFAWRIGKSGALGNVTAARQASLTAQSLKLVQHYPFVRVFTWFLLKDQSQRLLVERARRRRTGSCDPSSPCGRTSSAGTRNKRVTQPGLG